MVTGRTAHAGRRLVGAFVALGIVTHWGSLLGLTERSMPEHDLIPADNSRVIRGEQSAPIP
ncbi:MAG: hypothetical protein ACI835_004368 [Planctomycetota bacterium]|jgi:hypothetical protein